MQLDQDQGQVIIYHLWGGEVADDFELEHITHMGVGALTANEQRGEDHKNVTKP